MFSMLICNYVVAAVFLLLAGGMMYGAAAFPMTMTEQGPGPGFWPFLLGAGLALASVGLFTFSLARREDLAMKQVALTEEANRPVYKAMVLLVLFCAAIVLLGFFPAMVLFVPALMYLLKCRNIKWMVATTAGVLVFVYVVFGWILNTQFPVSIFLA